MADGDLPGPTGWGGLWPFLFPLLQLSVSVWIPQVGLSDEAILNLALFEPILILLLDLDHQSQAETDRAGNSV
jgi:hypothetical protein